MGLPNKVLISLTSYNGPFYADGSKTGVFYTEASHPFHVFRKAGYEVDFVSETGKFGYDDHSIVPPDYISQADFEEFKDESSEIKRALAATKKPSDVNAKDYGIFFASAGHATLFDYPKASGLHKIASEIYANGGIVSSVCHGPAIFDNLNDKSTGKPILQGKKFTGFTNLGEEQLQLSSIISKANLETVEELGKKLGAHYVAPPSPFADFSIVDGRIVTGANPASATSTAEKVVSTFKAL